MHGAISQHPQYIFMMWCLGKQRYYFTFTSTLPPPCTIHFILFDSVTLTLFGEDYKLLLLKFSLTFNYFSFL